MKVKIGMISDTHNLHNHLLAYWFDAGVLNELEQCDILLHAGDSTSRGYRQEVISFLEWFNDFKCSHKAFISGNHDFFFEKDQEAVNEVLSQFPNITYLNDSGCEFMGLKIWGSPVQPWFHDWAFNRRGADIVKHWDMIPEDTDILITHGPPKNILDEVAPRFYGFNESPNVGCPYLLDRVNIINPRIHLFGHIHEGHGTYDGVKTKFVNASSVTETYKPTNKPVIMTIDV